ncbi:hypothetical protein [Nocardia sp. NPDC020380]|uniref:hypothetical protein n=1 Tax=Nocardia sp. NPDC020380 TaxID=3364309 RepID=UPI0037B085F7
MTTTEGSSTVAEPCAAEAFDIQAVMGVAVTAGNWAPLTRNNSAASRAARADSRARGISYTAALYIHRTAAQVTDDLTARLWGADGELFAPSTGLRAGATYRLVYDDDDRSVLGTATGRQLLARPEVTDHRSGDILLVDVSPFLDFTMNRTRGYPVLTLGVVSWALSLDEVHHLTCTGCPYKEILVGLGRALAAAREHNDQHIEFPGDWGFARTENGRWQRIRC